MQKIQSVACARGRINLPEIANSFQQSLEEDKKGEEKGRSLESLDPPLGAVSSLLFTCVLFT